MELAKAGKKIAAAVAKRARQITVFLMDVDGTITDGGVTLLSLPDGSAQEIKTFDAHDGQGLSLAHTAGIRTGVITGRGSAALRRRAKELSIEFVYEKQPHKIAAYEEILKKTGATEAMVAYLGDDLPDITIMRRVGLAVAVGRRRAGSQTRGALQYQSHWRKRRGSRSSGTDPQKQRDLGRNDRQGSRLAGKKFTRKLPT